MNDNQVESGELEKSQMMRLWDVDLVLNAIVNHQMLSVENVMKKKLYYFIICNESDNQGEQGGGSNPTLLETPVKMMAVELE